MKKYERKNEKTIMKKLNFPKILIEFVKNLVE